MGGPDACREKALAMSDDKYRDVDFGRLLAERRWVDRPLTDVGDRPEGIPDSW